MVFDSGNSKAIMKKIFLTIVCTVVSVVVASPNIGLAKPSYSNRKDTLAQHRREVRHCRAGSRRRPDIVRETATGAAIGAVGGAITGNAGEGAIVGAGVGAADSATSRSGNVGRGALTGGAIGAVGGAIAGNTGRGAIVGASVGAANRAIRGNRNCR